MKNLIVITIMCVLGLLITTAHADITYTVNRSVDQGTVTGYIETDGTLGVLSQANIIDWELTLTAPNLLGGSPYVINYATQSQTWLSGSVTTATETDILFDISGGSGIGFFLLQGGEIETNYWCLETEFANCTGGGVGEHIGFDETDGENAQTANPTGTFSIATTRTPITYMVNRTVDQGTVTGYIETDGTLGVLNSANIIDWEFTLTAPNLLGGSPYVISHATQRQTILGGSVTTATETDIFFDISGGSGTGLFLVQGGWPEINYWCLETEFASCTGGGVGEHVGFDPTGTGPAQTANPTGTFSIASIASMCPADLTGDGILDFFDVSDFLLYFGQQDPIADFNSDGIFDFFDVSDFLLAFSVGCP